MVCAAALPRQSKEMKMASTKEVLFIKLLFDYYQLGGEEKMKFFLPRPMF
jgi:hypothetical protein